MNFLGLKFASGKSTFIITFLFLSILGLVATSLLSGCSPVYVMQAAYEEGKILLGREDIPDVIQDPETDPKIREKLKLVLRARNFAEKIGLTAKESFTQYSHVSKDVLAWVLLACKKDAFEPYTWWYPIVGTVPYKGFFEKEDAECDVDRLQARGYEIWLRGTEAFSTLGWFNDPILTTTLKHEPQQIANTVIHEIFHQTVWIPGSVDFNESVANVVGGVGVIAFFEHEITACKSEECRSNATSLLDAAKKEWLFEKELGALLTKVKADLDTLYQSDISLEQKLKQRDVLFNEVTKPFLKKYPEVTVLEELNNAAILQLYIYRKELTQIEAVYLSCNNQWPCFLDALKDIADKAPEDPFATLQDYITSSAS